MMKSQTKRNREKYRITRHFIISSVLIVSLLIGIPLVTVYLLTQAYDKQTRVETNQTSTAIRQIVQTFIGGAYNLCYELAENPGILSMDPDIQTQILSKTAARNDYMDVLFVTGMDGMQVARSEGGELGDRGKRWWFLQMKEDEMPFISKSYYSITTGKPCTALFLPMYNGDDMIGILGANINLVYIQHLIEKFTHPDSGCYSFIIDGEGFVIAHPDRSYMETLTNFKTMIRMVPATDDFGNRILNPDGSLATVEEAFAISEDYQAIVKEVMGGHSGQRIVKEVGSNYYISYEPIALPGYSDSWSVIALHERSASMSVIYRLVTQVLLMITLILIVFIALIVRFFISLRKTMDSLENIRDEADERTRIILNASPRINILFNSNFELIDCNPAAVQFMGFKTKEDMLAGFVERMKKIIPRVQSDGQPSMSVVDRLMIAKNEGFSKFETELHMDGNIRILGVDFRRVPHGDSFAIVGYIINMTDIRERERDLLRAHEQNEIQLTKLKLVVQATKIVLWDMEIEPGDMDPVNDARPFIGSEEFRHLLGFYDENDFPNLVGSFHNCLHPEDKERNIRMIEAHLLDRTGKTPYDIEVRIMKKNGEYGFYRSSGETIRNPDGSPIRLAGALMDITETKNLIQENETQRIKAETANKAKSAFLSTMSHEIRTPMNAILGITEIQLQNEAISEDVKEAFKKIYVSGDLLLSIINDILDLSKIEAGKMEVIVGKYEIASMISDTAQLYMMRTGSKPIGFELYVDENTPAYLVGDELRIKQILNNLLSNAFKYTAEGIVKLSISAKKCEGNGDNKVSPTWNGMSGNCADMSDNDENDVILIIKVSDTGQGLTEQDIKELFDEYARFNLETNRTTEGTGLGMSITRNLVNLMNGEIFVESEPGKGSLFTIYLPQRRIGAEVMGKETAENLSKFRISSRAQMKRMNIIREPMPYGNVLIVDDVETNIYVAKGLMSPYKLKIDSAGSGFAAIEKVRSGALYDVIFMDHMMPKMDGIEAVGILRSMGYKRPIVALTANAVSGQAEKFRESGFDDFISKPIDIRQLNSALNKFIRDRQKPEIIEAFRNEKMEALRNEKMEDNNGKIKITGLDTVKGLERFNSDRESYMLVLRSYVNSVRSMLDSIDNVREENLVDYRITVHGIKGASYGVFADRIGNNAEKLEKAAKDGDYRYIKKHNPILIKSVRELINSIDEVLTTVNEENQKPKKDKPDVEVLTNLLAACKNYDMDEVDLALAEIGKYQYDSDGGLAEWLLENIEVLSFKQIEERVADWI